MNRRTILAGAAALPAMSISALGANTEPDPIYAAIQRYRDTYGAHGKVLEVAYDPVNADYEAREALLEIQPKTIAGAAALLRYSWEFSEQPGEEDLWGEAGGYELHRHLALALERMI
jgi:hypothetical protein